MFDYSVVLRAMTQARGSFTMRFERYAELPGMLADKVIAAYKAEQENN
jgi:elongation factor G